MEALRLPRGLEDEPGCAELSSQLAARAKPLWSEGEVRAAEAELDPGLAAALRSAFSAGRIVRGLEGAEQALAAEQRGLEHVDRKTGVARGGRVSRLVVVTNDGSERFYRGVESLARKHAPRVLVLRVAAGEDELGERVCGKGRARLLMVAHKEAVSAVLRALAAQWSPAS